MLYAVNINTKPVSAKAYLKWGLISIGVSLGLGLLFGVLLPILVFSTGSVLF